MLWTLKIIMINQLHWRLYVWKKNEVLWFLDSLKIEKRIQFWGTGRSSSKSEINYFMGMEGQQEFNVILKYEYIMQYYYYYLNIIDCNTVFCKTHQHFKKIECNIEFRHSHKSYADTENVNFPFRNQMTYCAINLLNIFACRSNEVVSQYYNISRFYCHCFKYFGNFSKKEIRA